MVKIRFTFEKNPNYKYIYIHIYARMQIQANIVKIFKRYTHTLLQHT